MVFGKRYVKNTGSTAGQARHLAHVTGQAIAKRARGGCNAHSDGAHRYRGPSQQCKCGALHSR